MLPTKPSFPGRIDVVDVVRGSALAGILLLHAVSHFGFPVQPMDDPAWLESLNRLTVLAVASLFAGKAYALFSLMFGLSFFIIMDRAAKRGVDFRGRFLWRLFLLGALGFVSSLIHWGDILRLLAVFGVLLVVLERVGSRVLGWLSFLLVLQLPDGWLLVQTLRDSSHPLPVERAGGYLAELYRVFSNEGLGTVIRANLTTGQLANWTWNYESGRHLQMPGLFIWGMLLGRSRVLEDEAASQRFAWKVLGCGLAAGVMVFLLRLGLRSSGLGDPSLRVASDLIITYSGLVKMAVWAAGCVLLYQRTSLRLILGLLAPMGRMSLTCYVSQSVIGVILFYHFGFGLHRHLGPFLSLLVGVALLVLQCAGAHLWLRRFRYGPLEWLWRCATYLDFSLPLRKSSPRPGTSSLNSSSAA